MNPLVSVVMSAFNAASYLPGAIKSILEQTLQDFEFIIVDDCSADGTGKIVGGFANTDARIVLLTNPRNQGLTSSLNRGLEVARGRYIARMDADDVALPYRLEKQVDFLAKNPNVFLVGSQAENIDRLGRKICLNRVPIAAAEIAERLPEVSFFVHPTLLWRSAPNVRYREKFLLAQDYDFLLCLLSQRCELRNHPEVLLKYRVVRETVSRANRALQRAFENEARRSYRSRKQGAPDSYDEFDPNQLKEKTTAKRDEKLELEFNIETALLSAEFAEMRKSIRRYLKSFGVRFEYIFWYAVSLAGRRGYDSALAMLWFFRGTGLR